MRQKLLGKWLMSVSSRQTDGYTDAPWQRVTTRYICIGSLGRNQKRMLLSTILCQRPVQLLEWHGYCFSGYISLGTCEASRFDSNSNRTIWIRFESDEPIRNFRISHTCYCTTNHAHCSTKNFNRCTVVIEIYFVFMILRTM